MAQSNGRAKPQSRRDTGKAKRKATRTSWKPGHSGNPGGRPRSQESWADAVRRIGDMTPAEAVEYCRTVAGKLSAIHEPVTLKEAVVLRVYAALLFDPDARLLSTLMDRAEGKPTQAIAMTVDWRDEARREGVDPDAVLKQLVEQFTAAMAGPGGG